MGSRRLHGAQGWSGIPLHSLQRFQEGPIPAKAAVAKMFESEVASLCPAA